MVNIENVHGKGIQNWHVIKQILQLQFLDACLTKYCFNCQKMLIGTRPNVALARSQRELTTLFSQTDKKFRQVFGRRSYIVQQTDWPMVPVKAWQRIGLFSVPFIQNRNPFKAKVNQNGTTPPGAWSVSLNSIGTRYKAQHAPHRIQGLFKSKGAPSEVGVVCSAAALTAAEFRRLPATRLN